MLGWLDSALSQLVLLLYLAPAPGGDPLRQCGALRGLLQLCLRLVLPALLHLRAESCTYGRYLRRNEEQQSSGSAGGSSGGTRGGTRRTNRRRGRARRRRAPRASATLRPRGAGRALPQAW